MFKNYLVSIFRNLKRKKFYTLINVVGLSIGISSVVLIFLILSYEFSFDKYQPNFNNIYRVVLKVDEFGKTNYTPAMPYPLPPFLKETFPEIKQSAVIDANFGSMEVAVQNKEGNSDRYQEDKNVAYVGDDFFNIFKYDWISGNKETALAKNNSVVLSKSLAEKYFGNNNPIGRTLLINNKYNLEVTGLVKDPPTTSEFPLKMIITYDHFVPKRWSDNWTSLPATVQCMISLLPGTNIDALVKKINIQTQDKMNEEGEVYNLFLQPLSEVHFDNRFYSISNSTIAKKKLYALGIIGFLVLLISCINYINLNTALLSKNSIEIGIRKVLGGTKKHIFIRFILETVALTGLGFLIAAFLLALAVPQVKYITGYTLNFNLLTYFSSVIFLLTMFLFIVAVGGGYPAVFMTKSEPIKAIKSNLNFTSKRSLFSFKKVLVVLQFGISQILIIATLIVLSQIHFLKNAKMGFDKNSILEVSLPTRDSIKVETFRNRLLSNSVIQNVSFSSTGAASTSRWNGTCEVTLEKEIKKLDLIIKFIDSHFIKTYGIKLLSGENVRDKNSGERFLVNQEFVKEIGLKRNYDKVIGIPIKIWGMEGTVCGVFKDFNATSLHDKMVPMIMTSTRKIYNQAGIKLAPGNRINELKLVKAKWTSAFPENIYDYQFVDELIESFYNDDAKILTFLYIFSGLAIALACLGLLGLVSFITVNRTKEVGIRKVLGASIFSLLKLLSKDFLSLVLIANIISWPVAYYFMYNWLEDFAYRIKIDISYFLITTFLLLFIAIITIGYHSIKAALANPSKSLKYE